MFGTREMKWDDARLDFNWHVDESVPYLARRILFAHIVPYYLYIMKWDINYCVKGRGDQVDSSIQSPGVFTRFLGERKSIIIHEFNYSLWSARWISPSSSAIATCFSFSEGETHTWLQYTYLSLNKKSRLYTWRTRWTTVVWIDLPGVQAILIRPVGFTTRLLVLQLTI